MPAALVFMSGNPGFVASTKGTPLDCLVLEAKGSCSPGPRIARIKEIVLGRLLLPGHCTDSRLKYTAVFLKRKPNYLYRSFDIRGNFGKLIGVYGGALTEWRPGNTIFALFFCLTSAY